MIYEYSREQAIADGVLIDVSHVAQEVSIKWPVAVTAEVWEKYIYWTEADTKRQTYQDTEGRLWDMVWMLRMATSGATCAGVQTLFRFYAVPRGGTHTRAKITTLKAIVSPGDDFEPVITVMLLDED